MKAPVVLGLMAGLALAACSKPAPSQVDDAALDAVGETVEAGLNEPGQALVAMLKSLDGPRPIGLDAMQLVIDQRSLPVDWWLWRRGLLQQLDLATSRPTFLLTEQGRLLAASEALWFEADVAEPSQTDCQTAAAIEALGCEVDVTVTPTLTSAGRAIALQPALQPFSVHALVVPTGEGWEVRDLRAEGRALHDIALDSLLGPEAARQAARGQVMSELDLNQTVAAGFSPSVEGGSAPPAELAPREDVAPVAPVIGDSPLTPARPRLVP